MTNTPLLLAALLAFSAKSLCQTGIGTNTPNASAVLEVNAADKGLLLPRIALAETTSAAPMTAHVAGMVVYNTATSEAGPTAVSPGLYYNDGSSWIRMTTQLQTKGDLKYGLQSADHDGWYLLNGRAVNTLPTIAQNSAALLGYPTTLPNAADRFLKTPTAAETIGSVGGAGSFTLLRANLPNINLSGTTNSAGAHTHTYTDNAATARNYAGGSNNPLANNANTSFTTFASTTHTHTVSFASGGTGTAVNFVPSYMVTNVFIYLGN